VTTSTPTRPRASLRRGASPRAGLLLAALVAALAGCSLPSTEAPAPENDPSEAPVASSTPDPSRQALVAEVERLRTTVAAARDELAGALDPPRPGAARAAAEAALELLVADETGAGGAGTDGADDEPRPLFPSEPSDRGQPEDAADQLTLTLTRARDVGGSLGSTVVDLLRDPIAGDLGAWQRDAAGVLDSIDLTLRDATTLEEREAAVAELPGLGTRAIAWARLTAAASSAEDAERYAERGVANLDVITVTLDRLELSS
jgi:hypothetical protein